jgi:hypothetical protein
VASVAARPDLGVLRGDPSTIPRRTAAVVFSNPNSVPISSWSSSVMATPIGPAKT